MLVTPKTYLQASLQVAKAGHQNTDAYLVMKTQMSCTQQSSTSNVVRAPLVCGASPPICTMTCQASVRCEPQHVLG